MDAIKLLTTIDAIVPRQARRLRRAIARQQHTRHPRVAAWRATRARRALWCAVLASPHDIPALGWAARELDAIEAAIRADLAWTEAFDNLLTGTPS